MDPSWGLKRALDVLVPESFTTDAAIRTAVAEIASLFASGAAQLPQDVDGVSKRSAASDIDGDEDGDADRRRTTRLFELCVSLAKDSAHHVFVRLAGTEVLRIIAPQCPRRLFLTSYTAWTNLLASITRDSAISVIRSSALGALCSLTCRAFTLVEARKEALPSMISRTVTTICECIPSPQLSNVLDDILSSTFEFLQTCGSALKPQVPRLFIALLPQVDNLDSNIAESCISCLVQLADCATSMEFFTDLCHRSIGSLHALLDICSAFIEPPSGPRRPSPYSGLPQLENLAPLLSIPNQEDRVRVCIRRFSSLSRLLQRLMTSSFVFASVLPIPAASLWTVISRTMHLPLIVPSSVDITPASPFAKRSYPSIHTSLCCEAMSTLDALLVGCRRTLWIHGDAVCRMLLTFGRLALQQTLDPRLSKCILVTIRRTIHIFGPSCFTLLASPLLSSFCQVAVGVYRPPEVIIETNLRAKAKGSSTKKRKLPSDGSSSSSSSSTASSFSSSLQKGDGFSIPVDQVALVIGTLSSILVHCAVVIPSQERYSATQCALRLNKDLIAASSQLVSRADATPHSLLLASYRFLAACVTGSSSLTLPPLLTECSVALRRGLSLPFSDISHICRTALAVCDAHAHPRAVPVFLPSAEKTKEPDMDPSFFEHLLVRGNSPTVVPAPSIAVVQAAREAQEAQEAAAAAAVVAEEAKKQQSEHAEKKPKMEQSEASKSVFGAAPSATAVTIIPSAAPASSMFGSSFSVSSQGLSFASVASSVSSQAPAPSAVSQSSKPGSSSAEVIDVDAVSEAREVIEIEDDVEMVSSTPAAPAPVVQVVVPTPVAAPAPAAPSQALQSLLASATSNSGSSLLDDDLINSEDEPDEEYSDVSDD